MVDSAKVQVYLDEVSGHIRNLKEQADNFEREINKEDFVSEEYLKTKLQNIKSDVMRLEYLLVNLQDARRKSY